MIEGELSNKKYNETNNSGIEFLSITFVECNHHKLRKGFSKPPISFSDFNTKN